MKSKQFKHLIPYLLFQHQVFIIACWATGFGLLFVFTSNIHLSMNSYYFLTQKELIREAAIDELLPSKESYSFFTQGIHYHRYRFSPDDIHEYNGLSFSSTSQKKMAQKLYYHPEKVRVEYIEGRPEINRIKGENNSYMSDMFLIMLVIYTAVSIAANISYQRVRNLLHLLETGEYAAASLTAKPRISTYQQERYYCIPFVFSSREGKNIFIEYETTEPYPVLNDAKEWLVYRPNNPYDFIFIDTLPKKLREAIYQNIIFAGIPKTFPKA